jgi:hypothetical protein
LNVLQQRKEQDRPRGHSPALSATYQPLKQASDDVEAGDKRPQGASDVCHDHDQQYP